MNAGTVTNTYNGANEAVLLARETWIRKNQSQASADTRIVLSAMDAGIAALSGVISLIGGIKGRTPAKDQHKYTIVLRNLTPYMIVINGGRYAVKGEGAHPVIKPDESLEWVFTRADMSVDASAEVRPLVVAANGDSLAVSLTIDDRTSNGTLRTVRLSSIAFGDAALTDPCADDSWGKLATVYYKSPSDTLPLLVTSMPIMSGIDGRVEIVFLSSAAS